MVPHRRPASVCWAETLIADGFSRCTSWQAGARRAQQTASVRVTCAPLLRRRPARRFTHETIAGAVGLRATSDRHRAAIRPPGNALYTRNPRARRHTSPDAAAAPAGETHTYEADQDGDLNLQLTMVSFADAKAKKGETYVVYAAADDGAAPSVQTPWRNG